MTLLWLVACSFGDPVANCDQPTSVADCCVTDDECRAFYGGEFPYCYFPGRRTGICAECQTDADCIGASVCIDDTEIGALCCDPNVYYCD